MTRLRKIVAETKKQQTISFFLLFIISFLKLTLAAGRRAFFIDAIYVYYR